jgi:hypothetical protein
MFSRALIFIAAAVAAVAVAVGAYALVSNFGNGASSTASAAPAVQFGQGPSSSGRAGPNQTSVGQIPSGWQPGSGTIITGAAADNAKAVALAKYPGGTVNRVLKLSDGSYAVHMIKISWPHHVFVSTSFQVMGAIG